MYQVFKNGQPVGKPFKSQAAAYRAADKASGQVRFTHSRETSENLLTARALIDYAKAADKQAFCTELLSRNETCAAQEVVQHLAGKFKSLSSRFEVI